MGRPVLQSPAHVPSTPRLVSLVGHICRTGSRGITEGGGGMALLSPGYCERPCWAPFKAERPDGPHLCIHPSRGVGDASPCWLLWVARLPAGARESG